MAGDLLGIVTNNTINQVDTPTIINVVEGITPVLTNIDTIDTITTVTPAELFNTTATIVASNVDLFTTTTAVLDSAALTSTSVPAITTVDPVTGLFLAKEDTTLNGDIQNVGDGIVTVSNSNGDISIYNTCDISAVEK